MSPLEILQLIGYSMAAVLPTWMGLMLLRRRHALSKVERVLLSLAFSIGAWHASNLVLNLHGMLGLSYERWTLALRLADTVSVVSVTLLYSFLLHVHLHLWANARGRTLSRMERVRVYLSYIPALFLVVAVPPVWTGAYAPMLEKTSSLLLPFALWAAYVLSLVAGTDFLIARGSRSASERRLMLWLAASFIAVALLILLVYAFHVGEGSTLGVYLKTIANLGSLAPTALLAYHVYRYRYLELLIRESLIVASFASLVLIFYLYGVRAVGGLIAERYGLRPASLEALLILMLAVLAAPLRRWLDRKFHQLFEHEAALYRDVVTRVGAEGTRYRRLPELLRFIEERTVAGLGLRRVKLLTRDEREGHRPEVEAEGDAEGEAEMDAREWPDWAEPLLEQLRAEEWQPLEDERLLREQGYRIAYALRREEREVGLMLVDAAPDALTRDVRAVLEILAGQVAIAIEDFRLVEENVRLERRLAQRERLAALGQMAATVAHEVRNPLSAIKSIAQVMREDRSINADYLRDLDLIVGETDRLSRSVTQMLSFARSVPPAGAPQRADEIIRMNVELFRLDANQRGVSLDYDAEEMTEERARAATLDGERAAAVRDALSNLLLNALQATPAGGRVRVGMRAEDDHLVLSVEDSGRGVASEMRQRIWEPFFTTRQRGTGLGLAIVRKRMEEVGGSAVLASAREGQGARFELRLPLSTAAESTSV